jgi:hypothetical protein
MSSGLEPESWAAWVRPIAMLVGAISAGAGAGVGTAYFQAPPPGSAAADVSIVRRLADVEAWREAHDRDISKRWEDAGDKMAGNRAELERLRNEVTETNRRMDRMVDRERARGGGASAFIEPAR